MKYSRQELVDWVQSRIDEIAPLNQVASFPAEMIEKELDEAATHILRTVKRELLYPLVSNYKDLFALVTLNGSVIIPISETFIRFIRMKIDTWSRAQDGIVNVDSDLYKNQTNTYLAATKNKPVVALIPFYFEYEGEGGTVVTLQALECFPASLDNDKYKTGPSSGNETEIEISKKAAELGYSAVFNSDFEEESQKSIISELLIVVTTTAENMPDNLTDALVWLAAGKVLTSLREPTLAKAAYDNFVFAIGQPKMGFETEEKKDGK